MSIILVLYNEYNTGIMHYFFPRFDPACNIIHLTRTLILNLTLTLALPLTLTLFLTLTLTLTLNLAMR